MAAAVLQFDSFMSTLSGVLFVDATPSSTLKADWSALFERPVVSELCSAAMLLPWAAACPSVVARHYPPNAQKKRLVCSPLEPKKKLVTFHHLVSALGWLELERKLVTVTTSSRPSRAPVPKSWKLFSSSSSAGWRARLEAPRKSLPCSRPAFSSVGHRGLSRLREIPVAGLPEAAPNEAPRPQRHGRGGPGNPDAEECRRPSVRAQPWRKALAVLLMARVLR